MLKLIQTIFAILALIPLAIVTLLFTLLALVFTKEEKKQTERWKSGFS